MVDSDLAGPSSREWRKAELLRELDNRDGWTPGAVSGPRFTHLSFWTPDETRFTLFRMEAGDVFVVERSGLLPEHLTLPAWSTHPTTVRESIHVLLDWAIDQWAQEYPGI